jgi:hypothetical protein
VTALLSLAACAVIAALIVWRLGGAMLRLTGGFLAIGGLLATASSGSAHTALGALLGALVWLAGHWLWALRHHYYRSPLARRIFLTVLPAQLDPARGWGVPNIPPECRR